MSDISRQAAIDAITDENILRNMDSVQDSDLHRIKRAVHRIIASLPSTQPISITWSDNTARKTNVYCSKSGYLCEFATEYGHCQLTGCVKERG